MLIIFHCPECDSKLEIEADCVGTEAACPKCGTVVTVPHKGVGPGATVGGFRIDKLLGRGGMGEVYLARQLSLNRMVALKILPIRLNLDQDMVDRFLNEMRLLAQLQSPNIVTAFEAGDDSGVLYLAMALVKGESLHKRLSDNGKLPEEEALEITGKLASALQYAWNKQRLLHRDVKPSNVLMDKPGEPKLVDFGLAKRLSDTVVSSTTSGKIFGTPNYMSPEQVDGAVEPDCRTDIYSLGATLYHMLTGQIPFAADTVTETLRKQAVEQLPDPRSYSPGLSDGCIKLMEKMLARDRNARYQKWDELLEDLNRVRQGLALQKPSLSTRGSVMGSGRWSKGAWNVLMPHAFPAAATAVIAALLAVILWGLLSSLQKPVETPPSQASSAKTESSLTTATQTVTSTVDPHSSNAGKRIATLRGTYAEALAYAQDNPKDFIGAIVRFEQVKQAAEGTEFARMAEQEIQRISQVREKRIEQELKALTEKANELARETRFEQAIALVQGYGGSFTSETAVLRAELIENIRQTAADFRRMKKQTETRRAAEAARKKSEDDARKAKAARKKQRDEMRLAQDLLADLRGEVAAALLAADTLSALEQAKKAESAPAMAPVLSQVKATGQFIRTVADREKTILLSFKAHKGTEVVIQLSTGETETRKIVSLDVGKIKTLKRFPQGQVEVDLDVSDLSVREQYRRLESEGSPVGAVMRGLLAFEAGYWEKALECFRESKHDMAAPLAAAIVAAQDKKKAEHQEMRARVALVRIVQSVGVPTNIDKPDEMLKALQAKSFSPTQTAKFRAAAADFTNRFSQTELAQTCTNLLSALSGHIATNAPSLPLGQKPPDIKNEPVEEEPKKEP